MIIVDEMKLQRKISKRKGKENVYYYVTFSLENVPIIEKFEELHNVEVISKSMRFIIPKTRPYLYHHIRYKDGTRKKIYVMTIPKMYGEVLWERGERDLKVIVEVPDLPAKTQSQTQTQTQVQTQTQSTAQSQ